MQLNKKPKHSAHNIKFKALSVVQWFWLKSEPSSTIIFKFVWFAMYFFFNLLTLFSLFFCSELKKLSEESLTRQPEEVFDIICKLGEGSYGSVYKALHKESGQVLAIKQVPVDTDLQEIIKEISIMQQCDSPYVVKYYGSYFKNTDLWVSASWSFFFDLFI